MEVKKSSWSSQGKHKDLWIGINSLCAFVSKDLIRIKSFILRTALLLCAFSFVSAQTTTPNCIETTVYKVDGSSNNLVSRSYSDGLGRSIQSQSLDNATNNAIVTGTEYDDAGRPVKSVKTFPYAGNTSLDYISGDLPDMANSYYAYGGTKKDSAYTSTQYYDDPLGRVKAAGAPGRNFTATAHPVKSWYFGVTGTNDPALYFDDNGFVKAGNLSQTKLENDIPTALAGTLTNPIVYYLTVTMDPNGHFSQVLSDKFGRTVRTWAKTGSVSSGTSDEIVSNMSYDILGNVLTETPPPDYRSSGVSPTKHTYNILGQLVADTTPDKRTVSYTYYDNGQLHEVIDSNSKSMSTETDRHGCILTYAYDSLNRNVRIADSFPGITGPVIHTCTRAIYDDPETVRNFVANSAFTQNAVDLNAILTGITNTRGRVVASIAYDNKFVSTSTVETDESNYKGKVIDLFSYDDEGRINRRYKSIPGLSLQTKKFGYDLQGKILADTITFVDLATSNTKTIISQYFYDPNGRLQSVSRNDKDFVWYSYDHLGRMTTKEFVNRAIVPETYQVMYDYNVRDWVTKILSISDANFSAFIHYDDVGGDISQYNGNISYIMYRGYEDRVYFYDNVNRLTSVKSLDDPVIYNGYYDYLNDGRILRKREGTAQQAWGDYTYYGSTNRLSYIDSAGTQTHSHIYDNNGNMVFDLAKKMAIEYDWRNMPVKFTVFSSINSTLTSWQDVVDYTNNTTYRSLVTNEVVMTYDASGNRVKKEVIDYSSQTCEDPAISGTPGLLISYVPSPGATPTSSVLISTTGDLKTCLPVSTSTGASPVNSLILTDPSIPGTNKTLVSFSPQGVQFGAPVAGLSTPNVTMGSLVLYYQSTVKLVNNYDYVAFTGALPEPVSNSGVAYVDGSHVFVKNAWDKPYGLSYVNFASDGRSMATGEFEYYVKDHLGSTREVLNEGWQVQEEMDYMGYGKEIPRLTTTADARAREKFTGKELDEEAGMNLSYFGKRYYDAEIGKWTAVDPVPQYWDMYNYCGDKPINGVDPDGSEGPYTPQIDINTFKNFLWEKAAEEWEGYKQAAPKEAMELGKATLITAGMAAVVLAPEIVAPTVRAAPAVIDATAAAGRVVVSGGVRAAQAVVSTAGKYPWIPIAAKQVVEGFTQRQTSTTAQRVGFFANMWSTIKQKFNDVFNSSGASAKK
jgi:RHS repeat-associated protein